MTQKLNTDNGLQGRWTRTTGYNTGLKIVRLIEQKQVSFERVRKAA